MIRSTMILFSALALGVIGIADSLSAQSHDLSDPEIAHIAVTANALDVEAARLALDRSDDAAVRDFARTMIRDHEGVIEQAKALAGRLGVTPRDNATSRSLSSGAEKTRRELSSLDGADFDRAYMQNEVEYHETVIAAIEQTLIPSTENGELRGLLEAVLPALEAHLEHARSVLRQQESSR